MKAAIYNDRKQVTVCRLDNPVRGEFDVMTRHLFAGIYGADVAAYAYRLDAFPLEKIGHETVIDSAHAFPVVIRPPVCRGGSCDV